MARRCVLSGSVPIKPTLHDTDTDILTRILARVGRKDVGLSVESVLMSVSWNAAFTITVTKRLTTASPCNFIKKILHTQ